MTNSEEIIWEIVEMLNDNKYLDHESLVDDIESWLDWHGFDLVGLKLGKQRNKRCV
jgi:hypothetical protein